MSLRHALLGLLADQPGSGYELTKRFEISLANVWSAKHSQIYPELQKLAAAGLVEAGEEGARGRRDYEITAAGREELHRWLLSDEPERSARNAAMLRVFFLWTLPPEEAASFLDAEAARYRAGEAALADLDPKVPWGTHGSALMSRMALEQGLRWHRTMADWAAWAAGQIRAGHDATTLTDRQPPR